jgi:hypothetical protein
VKNFSPQKTQREETMNEKRETPNEKAIGGNFMENAG